MSDVHACQCDGCEKVFVGKDDVRANIIEISITRPGGPIRGHYDVCLVCWRKMCNAVVLPVETFL